MHELPPSPDPTSAARSSLGPEPSAVISRQVALAFGSVFGISVVMCGMLLAVIGEVSGQITEMRAIEEGNRRSLALAAAVREQYIHLAHDVLEADGSHRDHYQDWRDSVLRGTRELRPLTAAEDRVHLDHIARGAVRMDRTFREGVLPAMARGDEARVRLEHRRIVDIAEHAAEHADTLAASFGSRMTSSHVSATQATHIGLFTGAACVLCVLALSVFHTLRLRTTVLHPLRLLARAAHRFGSGDLESRVGVVGRGELQAVASAFDRMTEEVAAREVRLVRSERMAAIGQLAAGIAHELNNPIGIIRGYLKTMSPGADPETLREELQILDEEASHCQRIAEDLLAYARLSELRVGSVNVRELLDETLHRIGEGLGVGAGRVRVEADDGAVDGDRDRLRQVVTNLLTNAVRASANGAPIDVRGMRTPTGYEITVADRGPGIPKKDLDRIFEPFFTRRRGGSGLGLAVSLGIVRDHGGTIEVLDREGGGTVFRVRLPHAPRTTPGA